MAMIAEEHPKFLNTNDPEKRLALWASAFRSAPKGLVEFAAYRALAESPFEPKLADIVARVKEMLNAGQDDAVSAWGALARAAERATVVTQEEFEALPYEVRRFCGGLSGLRDMGNLEADIFNTVTRGQFMKAYEGLKRAKETLEIMPPELKALVQAAMPPRQAKKMPPGLPARAAPHHAPPPLAEAAPSFEEYTPLSETEWAERREAMLRKLGLQ